MKTELEVKTGVILSIEDYNRLQAELAAERARRIKAEEVVDILADAITWASGSDDFNEGGKAREGWLKLGRPSIERWLEYRAQYPRGEKESGK